VPGAVDTLVVARRPRAHRGRRGPRPARPDPTAGPQLEPGGLGVHRHRRRRTGYWNGPSTASRSS